MTLPAIYISLHLLTVLLFFIKKNWTDRYKKMFITSHLILLLFVLLDIFVINLRGVWVDRIIVVAFLLTASTTFALYRKTLNMGLKLYFGFFFFYPFIVAVTFLIDRIMFVVVASPLLVSLTIPETKFDSKEYELREIVGAIAQVQLALVKKGFVTEKYLGASNDEEITNLDISGLTVIQVTNDSTVAILKSGDKNFKVAFRK